MAENKDIEKSMKDADEFFKGEDRWYEIAE